MEVFTIGEGKKKNIKEIVHIYYIFVLFAYVYKYLKLFNNTANKIGLLDNHDKNNENLAIKSLLKEVSLYITYSL